MGNFKCNIQVWRIVLHKGWFTLDAAVCVFHSGLRQCRDRKFSISLQKRNCLPQTHMENALMWMSLKRSLCLPFWPILTLPVANPIKLYMDRAVIRTNFLPFQNLEFTPPAKCDQMVRSFLNIWPFATLKISPTMSQICQSRLNILPNKK